jgi:hypothetical protein
MPSLKDSFEIAECVTLLQDLMPPAGVAQYQTFDQPESAPQAGPALARPFPDATRAGRQGETPPVATPVPDRAQEPSPAPIAVLATGHKEERLENALQILCQRGGFSSAIIADDQGLALADYNSPVGTEVLAAFATVLGGAIAQASHFLDQHEANNISMDINYADKAVVRKFTVRALSFYLFIICPQDVDERNEVELSMETIMNLLNT